MLQPDFPIGASCPIGDLPAPHLWRLLHGGSCHHSPSFLSTPPCRGPELGGPTNHLSPPGDSSGLDLAFPLYFLLWKRFLFSAAWPWVSLAHLSSPRRYCASCLSNVILILTAALGKQCCLNTGWVALISTKLLPCTLFLHGSCPSGYLWEGKWLPKGRKLISKQRNQHRLFPVAIPACAGLNSDLAFFGCVECGWLASSGRSGGVPGVWGGRSTCNGGRMK